MTKPETNKDYYESINRVLEFIYTNPYKIFSLDELAEIAHFSSYHFHRVFKTLVGETPKEHIDNIRMQLKVSNRKSSGKKEQ